MVLSTTEYGKAYEYACLKALHDRLAELTQGEISIRQSDAFRTARQAFENAESAGVADRLLQAAHAAARVILRLEPQLQYGSGALTLAIQADAQGIAGDVRDVVCSRAASGWEIGISCKHNHHAVKHSRLSATIDFGTEWFGIPCSGEYFRAVVPIFHELRDMRHEAVRRGLPAPLWADIPDKAERYYKPILNAFLRELNALKDAHPEVPGQLIRYMLGRHDFYKVITDDRRRTTRIEAINLAGTLNRSANGHESIVDVARLHLPRRFYHTGFVPGSDNKVEIACDEGWVLTMRIHNASSRIEPSLKFDVQLVSSPASNYAQVEPW